MSWTKKSGIAYGWRIPHDIEVPDEIATSDNFIILEDDNNKDALFAIGYKDADIFPGMIELYDFFKQFNGNDKERAARALYLKYFADTSPSLFLYTRID